MKICIVINDLSDVRADNLKTLVSKILPDASFVAIKDSITNDALAAELSGPFDLVIHHCGTSNDRYQYFVQRYRKFCTVDGLPCPPIILFSGGGTSAAEDAFCSDPAICVVNWSDLIQNLPAFITAFQDDSRPRWEYLKSGGGIIEAALQLLTSVWKLQLEWETTGKLPSSKEGNLHTLEGRVRAFLLGSANLAVIQNDTLAKTLFDSHPTAIQALTDLKELTTNKTGWHDWNVKLKEYSRSWLGKD